MDLPRICVYAIMATIHRLKIKCLIIKRFIIKGTDRWSVPLVYSSVLLYGNRTVNVVFTCGSLVAVTVPWCKLITLFTKYKPSPIP